MSRNKGSKKGKCGLHVLGIIACWPDNRAENAAFSREVGPGGNDRHSGAKRDLIEAGLPVGGSRTRSFGRDHQDEIVMRIELRDNLADKVTLVATTEETQSPMLMPAMPPSEYIKVDISAVGGPDPWTIPVSAYFRRNSSGWTLVGFERMP